MKQSKPGSGPRQGANPGRERTQAGKRPCQRANPGREETQVWSSFWFCHTRFIQWQFLVTCLFQISVTMSNTSSIPDFHDNVPHFRYSRFPLQCFTLPVFQISVTMSNIRVFQNSASIANTSSIPCFHDNVPHFLYSRFPWQRPTLPVFQISMTMSHNVPPLLSRIHVQVTVFTL